MAVLRWKSEAGEVRGRGWRPLGCSWGCGEAIARPGRDSGAVEQSWTQRRRGTAAGRGDSVRRLGLGGALVDGRRRGARAPICRAAERLGVRARGWKAGEIFGEHHGVRLHGEGKTILAAGPGLSAGCELRGRTGRVRARCRAGRC